jgi:Chalcone isomerase-like
MSAMALLTLAAGLVAAPAGPVAADTTFNGVTLPGEVQVGGRTLVLNGVALRKKAVFKVYVAGLYLPARSSDAGQVLAADEPRHMVLQFLRGVDKGKMCDAWNEALANNTPGASEELKQQFVQLCSWM